MLPITTKSKAVRFLLSCLVYKILKGDFNYEDINNDNMDWGLSADGPEARNLERLYGRKLDFRLVKALFTQTVHPSVCDIVMEETIFDCLTYGGFREQPSPALYKLTVKQNFIKQIQYSHSFNDIDDFLGWSQGQAEHFFANMYNGECAEVNRDLRLQQFDDNF